MSRFTPLLKELRIHCSQTSIGSKGTRFVKSMWFDTTNVNKPNHIRQFVANQFLATKAANPTLPILVREAASVEARLFARYANGVERKVILENLDENAVADKIKLVGTTAPSAAQI